MLRTLSVVALALIVSSASGARHLASSPAPSQQSVTEYIASEPDLQIFSAALEAVHAVGEDTSQQQLCSATDLDFIHCLDTFSPICTYGRTLTSFCAAEEYNTASAGLTVFAPSDTAFETLAETLNMTVDGLLSSSLILRIVQYSASSQPVRTTDFSNNQNLLTLLVPQSVTIQMTAAAEVSTQSIAPAATETITVVGANSQATIISADAQVGKTFINVIDEVLLPALEVELVNS